MGFLSRDNVWASRLLPNASAHQGPRSTPPAGYSVSPAFTPMKVFDSGFVFRLLTHGCHSYSNIVIRSVCANGLHLQALGRKYLSRLWCAFFASKPASNFNPTSCKV